MDKYEIISQVGEGSFGQVYKARRRIDGQIVALKIIRKSGKSVEELKSLQRECKIQRHLNHPNIIRMLDSFETEYEMVVITEYAKNQLYEILARNGRLSEERTQVIACDLVSALYYLHSNRILHRDLKPQNVLLDNNGVSKLCDFGFARIMSSEVHVLTSVKGTPLYMAPELIEEYPYDHNVDLWSLGCIIYELLTGVPPFPTSSIVQLIHFIRHQTIKWPNFISSNCRSFLQGLLQKDSKVRLTWPNLLYHPFVKERVLIITENVPLAKNNFPSTNKICTGYSTNHDNKMQEKDNSSIINNQLQNRQKEFYDTHNMNCAIMQDCIHCSDIYSEKFITNKTNITNCASKTENLYNYNCHNYLYNNACENSTKLVKVLSEISSKPQNIVANAKKNEELDSICKIKKSQNCKLSNTTQEIVNEEWLAFLQRSMEEIMDGEIESLLQENCVIVFVSPLSNSTVSCKVIEYISCLLSLPFVLSIKKEDLENIQDIYLQAKVIPNLVCAMKTIVGNCNETDLNLSEGSDFTSEFPREKVQALEASTVLLCRLIYMHEKFVMQFCSSIFSSSEVILFSSLLNLESGKSRIVADLIAVLIRVLQTQGENSNIVEKILLKFQRKGIIRLLTKLLTHHQKVLRLRTCNLICLLAKFKCTTLQQIWGKYIRNLLENLTNDDMDVQAAAEETLKELQRLPYFHEELQAA